jgi:flagellar assembly protein FliH
MALIKGQNAQNAARDAVVLDLSDIGQQAEKIKADAQEKADRIVAEAEQRAQQLVDGADERGYEAGYQRGHEAGFAQGQEAGHAEALQQSAEQLQQLQQVWLQALQQWEQDSQWLQREARDGAVQLATRLAEKILHRQIEVDPSVILDQLSHGLAQVMRPLEVTVYLHPDDRPLVEEALPDLLQQFSQVQQLHLVEQPELQRGGCQLSYGQGGIDLTLDKQLHRLTQALLPQGASAPAAEAEPQAAEPPAEQDKTASPTQPPASDETAPSAPSAESEASDTGEAFNSPPSASE